MISAEHIKREIRNQVNYNIYSFSERIKVIMISMFIWGVFAHGFMLFNKFSYHDDAVLLFGMEPSGLVSQGRWGMALFSWLLNKAFVFDYSLPAFKGFIAIFLMGVFWIALSGWLELNNRLGLILVGAVMVVCSTMASCFGYMFSAPFLPLQFIISLICCYIICETKGMIGFCIGIGVGTFMIGMYQAGFVYILTLFVLIMINKVLNGEFSNKDFILSAMKYIAVSILCLIFYLLITKISLEIFDIQMTDYYGLNSMGMVSISEYLKRMVKGYITFFVPNLFTHGNAYPKLAENLYALIIVLLIVNVFCSIRCFITENKRNNMIQFILLLIVFPIVVELLIVLSPAVYVHSMFTQNFVYILLFILVEKNSLFPLKKATFFAIIFLINISFCQYDNGCYLKAAMLQEHAIGYCNNLITRIQMVEGYTEKTPVYFAAERLKKEIDSLPEEFDAIEVNPYSATSLANNYVWIIFMRNWCNFKQPVVTNPSMYFNEKDLDEMPVYPDDGGVQMINGVIVVKFNEKMEEIGK